MKLDPRVITILQNFQSINPSIVIKPGNVIRTRSPTKTIFAQATVPNTFPLEFGIFDVSRFLALLSLLKDAEVEFYDSHLEIKSGHNKLKYTYSTTNQIAQFEGKQNLPPTYVEFVLKPEQLTMISKAMNIMKYENIFIRGNGNTLTLSAEHDKNKSSEVFSIELGETDKTFTARIEADKLKIIPMNYVVKIAKEGIAHFVGEGLEYWIPLNDKSKFN